MRTSLFGLVLLAVSVSGCDMDSLTNKKRTGVVTPVGIASADDVNRLTPGSESGTPAASTPVTSAPVTQRILTIPREPAKVVDKAQAMSANSNLVVVREGVDPIAIAASTRVSVTTQLESLNLRNHVKNFHAAHGRFPTFDEYMQQAKQTRAEFNTLPPYQSYGYDARTGTVDLLEDRAERRKQFEAAGIPLNE